MYYTVHAYIQQCTPPEGRDSPGPLQRTAWVVARQPDFARFVKEIQLPKYDFNGQNYPGPFSAETKAAMADLYATALLRPYLPQDLRLEIRETLKMEVPVAHLAFLLAMCNNLERLLIRGGTHGIGRLVWKVLAHGTNANIQHQLQSILPFTSEQDWKPTLHSLTEISLGGHNYETALSSVLHLLSLPNLQLLNVYGLSDTPSWPNHDMPPASETKTHSGNRVALVLQSCVVSGEGLARLLASCPSPFSLTARWRPGPWNDHLSNEDLGDALRREGRSLEHVLLDTTDVYNCRHGSFGPPSFGSFESLTKLRSLAVPEYAFGPSPISGRTDYAAVFPPQLEELYVLGVGRDEANQPRAGQIIDPLAEERDAAEEGEIAEAEEAVSAPISEHVGSDPNEKFFDERAVAVMDDTKLQLPKLRKVRFVPWHFYTIEEWFGKVQQRCVDYEMVKDLGLNRLR